MVYVRCLFSAANIVSAQEGLTSNFIWFDKF